MAIALDVSTPVRWTATPANGVAMTSASFTAPSGAVLVVTAEYDAGSGDTLSVTCADSGGLVWTRQVERNSNETTTGGYSGIFTAITASSVSRTVTLTRTGDGGGSSLRASAVCYVFTGADTGGTLIDTVTANNEGGNTATPLTTTSLTPGANGVLVVACTDWNAKGAMTSSDLKGIDSVVGSSHGDYAGAVDVLDGWKTCTSGVGVTGNVQNGAAGPQNKWVQIILREPPSARRFILGRH
jgi:hypothetical protein